MIAKAGREGRAPTASESKANAFGLINQLVSKKDANGVPYTENGFFTAQGFKTIVNNAAEDGLSRADLIAEYPGMFAPGGAKAYGLTPTEAATLGI